MTAADYVNYEEWKSWGDETFGAVGAEASRYYAAEMQRTGMAPLRGSSVLELGFGNGEFASWCRGVGAKYVGIEAIPELVARARRSGLEAHHTAEPWNSFAPDETFDLVIALDVFEHLGLDELLETFHKIRKAMAASGRFVARVPSGDSPFSRAIQHGDMTHRLAIGSSMVRQLAAREGFLVERIAEPAFPLRGLGFLKWIKRTLVTILRRVTYPILAHAFMGGGKVILTPNLVFVLTKTQ